MAATLGAVQAATSLLLGNRDLSVDNWTFKLYYQWSVTLLTGFSVLISCNQLFGDPISCDLPGGAVSDKVLKSYCWMYSTFNIPQDFTGNCARKTQSDNPMYNSYYQWVAIFLIFQALLFYVPRIIWLMSEGGLLKYLAKGRTGRIIEETDEKLDSLLATFKDNLQNKYNRYAFIFFGCEFFNLVVVLSQFFITDAFLENQFLFYGPLVYQYYSVPIEESTSVGLVNPMCEAFPRIASCTFWQYGTGGMPTSHQALCILSLNIIIDKVYLILWFWYVTVAVLGFVRIFCRLFQISSGHIRFYLMKVKMHRYFKRNDNLDQIQDYIIKDCTIGDWFVLYQMSKTLNKRFFHDFLIQLAKNGSTKKESTS